MDELGAGSRAPNFRLPANRGEEIGLSDYLGIADVILFFVREYG